VHIELGDEHIIGVVGKVLVGLGTAAVTLSSLVVSAASKRVSTVEATLIQHHDRILQIEHTYVSRADLEDVIVSLNKDLRESFDRAHARIDEIYRYPRQ
jgi:hypothetical protein